MRSLMKFLQAARVEGVMRVERAVRVVENHSLGKASFGRQIRIPLLHPEGASPSEWFSTTRSRSLGKASFGRRIRIPLLHPEGASPSEWFSTTRSLLLLLCLFLALPHGAFAQKIDREAAYRSAVPQYADPANQPLSVIPGETNTVRGDRLERFSYLSTNNQSVPAWLILPPGASATHPAACLVLLHGLGGSKEQMSGLALFAASVGYASLVIDLYGHGERVQSGALKVDSPPRELMIGVRQTAVDVRRGLDYLATRRDIDSRRVGLVGISLGAIIGTVSAGVDTRIKAIALISGGGDWGLILRTISARNAPIGGRSTERLKGMNWAKVNLALAPEDPLTFASHIAPRALLMLHGRKDDTIVPQSASELYAAARQPKEIHWYADYGHVPPPEVVYPALQAFFRQRL